jgi:hypothetical protein
MCHERYKIALFCGLSPPLDKSQTVVTVRDSHSVEPRYLHTSFIASPPSHVEHGGNVEEEGGCITASPLTPPLSRTSLSAHFFCCFLSLYSSCTGLVVRIHESSKELSVT